MSKKNSKLRGYLQRACAISQLTSAKRIHSLFFLYYFVIEILLQYWASSLTLGLKSQLLESNNSSDKLKHD